MVRLLIGLILGVVIFLVGLTALAGGADLMSRQGMSDDVIAAFVIGGLLIVIAVLIFFASIKAHRRRKAMAAGRRVRPVDDGEIQGVLMGVGMATMMNDDFDTDGGDFSD